MGVLGEVADVLNGAIDLRLSNQREVNIVDLELPPALAKLEETPVDIITFVDSPDYLNQRQGVFDSVRWMLDLFYNPNRLDSETGEFVHLDDFLAAGLEVGDLHFNEFVGFIGMRACKSVLAGVITLYEVYKLLCLPDPAREYGLMSGTDIHCTCCATSAEQAGDTVYSYVTTFRDNSPWFREYISLLSNTRDYSGKSLYYATGEEFAFRHKHIFANYKHSRSAGLHGVARKCMIIDEISRFTGTDGGCSARAVYEAAVTTTSSFGIHGVRACISAPLFETDMICERYAFSGAKFESEELAENYSPMSEVTREGKTQEIVPEPHTIGFHYPTWELNPYRKFDSAEFVTRRSSDPTSFWKIYGAIPPHAAEPYFIDAERVTRIFENALPLPFDPDGRLSSDFRGQHAFRYIMHLDPGQGRPCRFGIAIGHEEPHPDPPSEQETKLFVIDFAHGVESDPKTNEVDYLRVYELILELAERFELVAITSDRWNDIMMRQALVQHSSTISLITDSTRGLGGRAPKLAVGVQSRLVTAEDYSQLKTAVYRGLIKCVASPVLKGELLALEYKGGVPARGLNKTKDIADCVASVVVQLGLRTGLQRSYGFASKGLYGGDQSSSAERTYVPANAQRPQETSVSSKRSFGRVVRGVM